MAFTRLILLELTRQIRAFWAVIITIFMAVFAFFMIIHLGVSLQNSMLQQGRVILGGDGAIITNQMALDPKIIKTIQDISNNTSMITKLRTMMRGKDSDFNRLVELKAVDEQYSLVGENTTQLGVKKIPPLHAIISQRLAENYQLRGGQVIKLGAAEFTIADILIRESDAASNQFELGPRVLIRADDLPATKLLGPGSLVQYKLAFTLHNPADWQQVETLAQDNKLRIISADKALKNFSDNYKKFQDFLLISGLIMIIMAFIALNEVVKLFLYKRQNHISLFYSLGVKSWQIMLIHLVFIMGIIIITSFLAIGAGHYILFAISHYINQYLPFMLLINFPWVPAIWVMGMVVFMSLGCIIGHLSRLQLADAQQLFAQNIELRPLPAMPLLAQLQFGFFMGLALAMVYLLMNNIIILAFFLGGLAVFIGFIWGANWVIWRFILARIIPKFPQFYLLSVKMRHYRLVIMQIVVAMAVMMVLNGTIILLKTNISASFNQLLSQKAPNFYLLDINNDDYSDFTQNLYTRAGFNQFDAVPMLRGRITKMNDIEVEKIKIPADFAWVVNGDRGITFANQPPANANITAGEWWGEAEDKEQVMVSLDEGTAKAFQLQVGDTLTVQVLGNEYRAIIKNLRKINWNSLGVNFVMVFNQHPFADIPHNLMGALYWQGAEAQNAYNFIVERYPTIAVVDLQEIVANLRDIIQHSLLAVAYLGYYNLVLGVFLSIFLVYAYNQGQRQIQKITEYLGFSPRQLRHLLWAEWLLILLPNLLISAIVAVAANALMMRFLLNFPIYWAFSIKFLLVIGAFCLAVMVLLKLLSLKPRLARKK